VNIFISIIVWVIVGVSALIFFCIAIIVWLLTSWWDNRLWFSHRFSSYWALFYIWCNPLWKIRIEGQHNIKKGETYIIVSNHQSALDILLLYRLFTHFKWVAKKELFRVPVIGWNLWLNRYITIERKNPKDALQMIKKASEYLHSGSSVLLFAEGTRTLDGRVKKFKDGAFVLAKKTNKPILPVVIDGTLGALPKNGFIIKGRHKFRIQILPEINPDSFNQLDSSEIAQMVQVMIKETHKRIAPDYYQ